MTTNGDIIDKLKYLGLDAKGKIPNIIKNFRPLDYKPLKYSDDHIYRVYKYVNMRDIQILITTTNRLSSITEKYKKALPLYEYINTDSKENLERYRKFLLMVKKADINKIEEIEKEQEILNAKIPFDIKYPKDYLWQIYYSESTEEYFMLVPIEDLDYSAFFYLLKKQLRNANSKIFVPISNISYSKKYLTDIQISDIENYLWLFTKNWPLIYEVYNKNETVSLQILGNVYVYDDIQSKYKIKLSNKEDANKFYKLLKALFILRTEVLNHYQIEVSIDKKGSIVFNINNKKIIYEILSSFIKAEYLKAEEKIIELIENKEKSEKELKIFQIKCRQIENEYLNKERQISTFLTCKKTFLGRIKYFFKSKNNKKLKKEIKEEVKEEDINKKTIQTIRYAEIKEFYTLEELVEIYRRVNKDETAIKNIKMDIKAIKQKIKNLENKVKNANLYLEEIDNHKKNIFEFWKFTNKDRQEQLNKGEIENGGLKILKKLFNYELDFENLANKLDNMQRKNLTKSELNAVFLATTDILKDINDVARHKRITNQRVDVLKREFVKENNLLEEETFDIFGNSLFDNKIKTLANQKHREPKRDLYKILNLTESTTLEDYAEFIKDIIENIESCFKKIRIPMDLSLYKCDNKNTLESRYNVFNIRATDAIYEYLKENSQDEINLYKINIKEGKNIVAFTNAIYYDNINETLPLGMNISRKFLINNEIIDSNEKEKKKINILYYKEDENTEIPDICVKEVNIKEININ